jgi:protein-disulfide isomerase
MGSLFMRLPFARTFSGATLAMLAASVSCGGGVTPAAKSPALGASAGTAPAAMGPLAAAAPSEEGAIVPISATDPVWGSRRALVSIVIFGDFQCPYTAMILKTVQALEQKYGPSDLRVVWKDLPLAFHAQARPAAEAGQAVNILGKSDAFWKYWEQALGHQTDLSAASFESWAQGSGVDVASYRRLVDAHAGAAQVDAGRAVASQLGVTGTPTFVINGFAIEGAQPLDKLTAAIDVELADARARLAGGVAPDALYTQLAKDNWKPPAPDAEDDEPKEDDTRVWNVPVAGAPARGNASALVTIVEFSDFQCPYCKRVEATLKEVREKYGDKVRLVWRDEPLPFHPHAHPAAEVAREARAEKGDKGFWAAHDAIFDSQPKLEDDDLLAVAHTLGLDEARVKTALSSKRYAAAIQADADLSDDLHASGTPHFFINGRRLVGAQPLAGFVAIIDDEIHRAEALVAKGTPPSAVYDTVMKTAEKPPIAEVRHVTPRATAPFKGPAGARVVIEEFADFQCPFCSRADETLRQVTKTYGGKVKIVWRNLPLPFHEHAALAAEAAAEAQHQKGDVGFWAMHDKLFAHQSDAAGLEHPALDAYARELGLDVAAFDRAIDGSTHAADIAADTSAADAAKIGGTPAFIIGGYYIAGAQPFDKFRRIIDEVVAHGPAGGAP